MAYEKGMQIIFDMISGMAIVEFRGTIKTLGPFRNQREADEAGKKYCREQGWTNESDEPL